MLVSAKQQAGSVDDAICSACPAHRRHHDMYTSQSNACAALLLLLCPQCLFITTLLLSYVLP
jgi:hypothetical protein